LRDQELELGKSGIERKRKLVESQIAALRAELEYDEIEHKRKTGQEHLAEVTLGKDSVEMDRLRGGVDKGPVTKGQQKAGEGDLK
jgi:hypothetical protein